MAARKARRSSILKSRNSVGPGGDGGSEEIYSSEGTDGGANTTRNLAALLRKRVSFSQTTQVKEFEKTSSFASDGSNSASGTAIDMNQTVVDMDMSVYMYDNEEELENVSKPSTGDYTRLDHQEMSVVEGPNDDINDARIGGNRKRQGPKKDHTLCFPTDMSVIIPNDIEHNPVPENYENTRHKLNHTTVLPGDMSIVQRPSNVNSDASVGGNKSRQDRRKDQTLCFTADMSVIIPNDTVHNAVPEKSKNTRHKLNHTTVLQGDMSIVQSPNDANKDASARKNKPRQCRRKDQTLCFPTDMSIFIPNETEQQEPVGKKSGSTLQKMNSTTMLQAEMSIVESPNDVDVMKDASAGGTKSRQGRRKDQTLCFPTDMSIFIPNDIEQQEPVAEKSGITRQKMNSTTMLQAEMSIVESPNDVDVMKDASAGGTKSRQGRRKDQTLCFPTDMSIFIPNDIEQQEPVAEKSGITRQKMMDRTTVLQAEMSIDESPNEIPMKMKDASAGKTKSRQGRRKDQTVCFPTDMSIIIPNDIEQGPVVEKSGITFQKMNHTTVLPAEMSIVQSPSDVSKDVSAGGTKPRQARSKDQTLYFPNDMSVIIPNDIEQEPVGKKLGVTRQKLNHTTMLPVEMSIYQSTNEVNKDASVGGNKSRQDRRKDQTLCFPTDMSIVIPNDIEQNPAGEKSGITRQKMNHSAMYPAEMSIFASSNGNNGSPNVGGKKPRQGRRNEQTLYFPNDMSVFVPNDGGEKCGNSHQKVVHTGVHSEDFSTVQCPTENNRNANVSGTNSIQGRRKDQTIGFSTDMSAFTANRNDFGCGGGNTVQHGKVEKSTAMTTAVPAPRPVLYFGKPNPEMYRNPFGSGKNRRKIKMNSNSNQDSSGKLSFGVFANPKTPKRNAIQLLAKIDPAKITVEKVLTVNEHVQTSPALMMNLPKAMCNVSINCTIANHTDDESATSFVSEKRYENAIQDCENSVGEHELENDVHEREHENDVDERESENGVDNDGIDVYGHENNVDDHEDDVDNHEDDVANHEDDVDDHEDEVDNRGNDVGDHGHDIEHLVNDVDDHGNDVDDHEDDGDDHENDGDDHEDDGDDHEDDGDDHEDVRNKSEDNDQQQLDGEEEGVVAAMETCRSTASRKELEQFPEEDWDLEKPECLALSTIENKFHSTIQPDQLLDIQNLTLCDATGIVIDNGHDEDDMNDEMDEESDLDEKKQDESEVKAAEPIEFDKNQDIVKVPKNTKQNCVIQSGEIEDDESSDSSDESEVEALLNLNLTKAKVASEPQPKRKIKEKRNTSVVSDINSKIKAFIKKNSDDPYDKYVFITSIEIELAKLPEEQWNWISSKHNDFFGDQITEALLRLRKMYLDCLGSRMHRLLIGYKFGLSSK